ncbi:MAG: acyl-CoA dehydrogenase family protein [Myxococcales bacterium]|nr:acyl-CoA dehydrogenase [Myxococcales bacterium]HIM02357.1 acyl-CoA dehydrogenase [Myxococcales bacterium]
MDFQPTEDQKALQAGIRSFCEGQVSNERLPELGKSKGFDRALWCELAEMGVFGLRLSEDQGGIGLGYSDAVLVFEELGRRLVPGPLVWSHLAAGLVPGVESGEVVVGGVDLLDDRTNVGRSPEPIVAEHLDHIDVLLVLRKEGIERLDPVSIRSIPADIPLDPLTPIHHIPELPRGEQIADSNAAQKMRLVGAAMVAGQQLGLAEGALDLANEYAKGREQFGRPIGGFQAVKHLLAEMFVRQEAARGGAYNAAATLDAPEVANVARAVSSAKVTAGESAIRNARSCIQVHGGMGFTWEVSAHYYLKRSWVLENSFGTRDEHAETIASILETLVETQ